MKTAAHCLPQIRTTQQRIIYPIGKIRDRHRQRQLDNLFFGKMFAQGLQMFVPNGGCGAGYLVREVDCSLLFVIE